MAEGQHNVQKQILTLVAAALGLGVSTIPLVFGSFGILAGPLTQQFGWSRATISLALTFYVFGFIIASPLVGRMVDRLGVKPVILLSTLLYAAMLAIASQVVNSPATLYACYFGIAILGAGASPVTYSKIIASQFDARRGLALGVALSGVGVGTAIIPLIASRIIAADGWQQVYLYFGAFIAIAIIPLLALCLPKESLKAQSEEPGGLAVFAEALRDSRFVHMGLAFMLVGLGYTGMATQLVPLMIDKGLSQSDAAGMQFILGISVIAGRLMSGFLLDYVAPKWVAAVAVAATAVGIAIVIYTPFGAATYLGIFLMGLSAGAEVDVMAYMTARYFGLQRYGLLYGLLNSAYFVGTAIGPVLAASSFDRSGSYGFAGILLIAALIGALLFIARIREKQGEVQSGRPT
jgi:MFS family permease